MEWNGHWSLDTQKNNTLGQLFDFMEEVKRIQLDS